MADWRTTIRPREERILALTTRRDLSRQALAGLQAKMGHTAAGIVGALMAVKEHLRSEGHTDVDEKFSLAFRIADLEALQLSLIEKENNELRELYGEVSELHDLTLRQNVTDQSAHDEFAHKQHIASLTMQLEEQKIRVAELQNSLTVANEVGSSKSDLAQAEAIESLNIRLKDQSEELRLKTSALDEAKVRLADLLQSLTTVQQDKEIALKKIEDLLHRVEDLEVMVGGDAAAQTQIAALNQQVAELTRNLSTAQRDRDILRGEKELAEMGSRQAHDKVSAKLIGENEREHWQTQVARLNQDMSHLQNELDHSRAQSQSLQSALDQLRTKAQSLRGDLDQSWTRERNLQNSLVEAEKRIKELEQAVISQRHQLDQTNEQSQGHVREQTRIVQEIDRLTGYVEEQKRELDHWRSKSAGLQRINDRENKPQNNQVDAMTQLQRELDGQMARVSELTQNLVNVSRDQAALSATLRQVTGERDHLQREVVRFTGELEMAEQVGVKAREEVVMLAKAVKGKEAAMKKVDTLTLELEELRLGNSKLQDRHAQDLASLRKEHQGSQQELVELRTLNAQQKDAHDNLMAKLQDEKNERQMLEETMQTLERAVHDLEVQQVALRKERDQISDERDRQSQEISRTQARLSEIDELRMVTEVTSKELVETKGRAASAANRAEAMSEALKNQELMKTRMSEQIQEANLRENQLQQQLAELQQKVGGMSSLTAQVEQAKSRSEQLLEELRTHESSNDHMKSVISSMRKDMDLKDSRNADTEAELATLKTRCEELETEIGRLRDERLVKEEHVQSIYHKLQAISRERDDLAGQKNDLQVMVQKLSEKLENVVQDVHSKVEIGSHNAAVMARLQQTNAEYKAGQETLEKELANLCEEKEQILAAMEETLGASNDAAISVQNLKDRVSEQAIQLRERSERLKRMEEEMTYLREYCQDRDSLHQRMQEAEERLLIATASVKGKDALIEEKEQEINDKDERIKKLADAAWRATGEEGVVKIGAEGGDAFGLVTEGAEAELAEAKATIAALQGQVDQLSELWAATQVAGLGDQQRASSPVPGSSPGASVKAPVLLKSVPRRSPTKTPAGSAQTSLSPQERSTIGVRIVTWKKLLDIENPHPDECLRALREVVAMVEELEGKLSLKDEMLSKFQALIEEQSKKILTYEAEIKKFAKIRRDLDEDLTREIQRLTKDLETVTEHNSKLAAAMMSLRNEVDVDHLKNELKKMESQLAMAIRRGTEIQAEKDEAVALASESVEEVEKYRSRLIESQSRTINRIIQHWKHRNYHRAWSAWTQACEAIRTDQLLADTIGVASEDDVEKLLLEFQS